jgi:hypothetical protein
MRIRVARSVGIVANFSAAVKRKNASKINGLADFFRPNFCRATQVPGSGAEYGLLWSASLRTVRRDNAQAQERDQQFRR